MIVKAQETGVLELFWRHPISIRRSVLDAELFLARAASRNQLAQILRSGVGESAQIAGRDDPGAVRRVARAIASGKLIALEHRGEPLWSDSRSPLARLSDSVLLVRTQDTRLDPELGLPEKWLQTVLERHEIDAMWYRLFVRYGRGEQEQPVIADFWPWVRRLLSNGTLVPVYHRLPSPVRATITGALSPVPSVPNRTPDWTEQEDSRTFGSDHAAAEQIATLVSAAESGVPFCEVCNRAARKSA